MAAPADYRAERQCDQTITTARCEAPRNLCRRHLPWRSWHGPPILGHNTGPTVVDAGFNAPSGRPAGKHLRPPDASGVATIGRPAHTAPPYRDASAAEHSGAAALIIVNVSVRLTCRRACWQSRRVIRRRALLHRKAAGRRVRWDPGMWPSWASSTVGEFYTQLPGTRPGEDVLGDEGRIYLPLMRILTQSARLSRLLSLIRGPTPGGTPFFRDGGEILG